MFLAIEIHCIPTDVEPQCDTLLEGICTDVRSLEELGLQEVGIGIQLCADVSPYKLGDTIWADAQFRGPGSRDLPWTTVNYVNTIILNRLLRLTAEIVNDANRLANPVTARCGLVECNTTVQGVGHWAQDEVII